MADFSIGLELTAMQVQDLDAVMEIEQQSFPTPWSRETFQRELLHNAFGYYRVLRPMRHERLSETDMSGVINLTGADATTALPPILAYGGYWLYGDEAHIGTIAVHPAWRRQKLGERMLHGLLIQVQSQGAQQAMLEVRVGNQAAIHLYHKFGFVEVGRRKRYYRDTGEDALLMTWFGVRNRE